MRTLIERAKSYADRNFAIQVGEMPSIKVDISEHLKRANIAGATEALAGQWKDLKEELPPINTLVFVIREIGSIPEVSYHRRDGIFTAPVGVKSDSVTYWMYIPRPPKSK